MYLQSFVAPIYTYVQDDAGAPQALDLMGTGFFVGNGLMLTAAHVLNDSRADIDSGKAAGVCASPRLPQEGCDINLFIDISDYDVADQPYDVAVAVTEYSSAADRALGRIGVGIADHVSAIGYPESAFQKYQGDLFVQARVHRGYVQRVIPQNRLFQGQSSPPMFELDFPITKGMSGSPLLFNTGEQERVIGVCVGSQTSRLVDYSVSYVEDDGTKFTEKQVKVQEYGLAHELKSLLDWRPRVLKGKSLGEAAP